MVKRTAAQAIVDVMVQESVEKVFCVPGESYLSLLDALYDQQPIQLITGRHEGGVSFMAEGYAKASGKVGVCLATRGPGATNLSIGLHTAQQDSTPMVAFIGQVEHKFRDREGFQEVNFQEYFSHLTKWAVELKDASRAAEIVTRAFHVARTGRPGPVVVSLPQDLLTEVEEFHYKETKIYSEARPSAAGVKAVKEALETAKRPVIIAGGGVTATKSAVQLVRLSEKYQIPVVSAFRRFDAFPNQHPHYIGCLGLGTPAYLKNVVYDADVVLALGTRLSQVTTQDYTVFNPNTKLIHIDISPDEINKIYAADIGIVADVKSFIEELAKDEPANNNETQLSERIKEIRKQYEETSTYESNEVSGNYVNMATVIEGLQNSLSEDAIISTDAGNFFGWIYRYYQFKKEGTYIGPTSGAMGYGLPGAIGAKLAHPNKQVVSISGDGGFMMTMNELETMVRYQLPIIAIVANNNMFGTIRMHQENNYPERTIATDLQNPDFAKLMTVMGGHGELIEEDDEFVPALKRALASNKPAVIEVRTNPEQISVSKTINDLRGLVKH